MTSDYCTPLTFVCSDQEKISYPLRRLSILSGTIKDLAEVTSDSKSELPIPFSSSELRLFLDFIDAPSTSGKSLDKSKTLCRIANFLDLQPALIPGSNDILDIVHLLFSETEIYSPFTEKGMAKLRRHTTIYVRKDQQLRKLSLLSWPDLVDIFDYIDELTDPLPVCRYVYDVRGRNGFSQRRCDKQACDLRGYCRGCALKYRSGNRVEAELKGQPYEDDLSIQAIEERCNNTLWEYGFLIPSKFHNEYKGCTYFRFELEDVGFVFAWYNNVPTIVGVIDPDAVQTRKLSEAEAKLLFRRKCGFAVAPGALDPSAEAVFEQGI